MCKYTNIRNEYEQYIVEFQLFRACYISVKFEKIRYRVSSGKKYILLICPTSKQIPDCAVVFAFVTLYPLSGNQN